MKFLASPIPALPGSLPHSNRMLVTWPDQVEKGPLVRCFDQSHGTSCWIRENGDHVIRLTWKTEEPA